MARPILTDAERLAWECFPTDPDADVMGAYFTLADGEVDALRRLPTPAARLATAVALAAIRWLGFVPACLDNAPAAGAERLARQLDVDPAALDGYAPADRTAREHRQRAAQLARFCDARSQDFEALERLLVERALEHDSRSACCAPPSLSYATAGCCGPRCPRWSGWSPAPVPRRSARPTSVWGRCSTGPRVARWTRCA